MTTYTPELLERMADRHDAHSVCTQPARDHFAEVCRELASTLRGVASVRELMDDARRSAGGPYTARVDVLLLERALSEEVNGRG